MVVLLGSATLLPCYTLLYQPYKALLLDANYSNASPNSPNPFPLSTHSRHIFPRLFDDACDEDAVIFL